MKSTHLFLSTIDPEAQSLARQYGLGLEIAEYCTAWNMDEHYPETHEAVRGKLTGIERCLLHAPFNELFPCAIDPEARALAARRYRQAIALAKRYGAEKLIVHGGYNPWLYYPEWYTEQSAAFWKEFLQEDPGLQIVLENVLEERPEPLLDILRAVDSPKLRMCLDIGHANAYSKTAPMEWLEACADCVSHFHIHNNDGSWDTHSPLMKGTIPMEAFLTRAAQLCPEATYTLELPEAETSLRWLRER